MKGWRDNLEERPFNMALALLENINQVLKRIDEAVTNQDLISWYLLQGQLISYACFKVEKDSAEEQNLEGSWRNVKSLLQTTKHSTADTANQLNAFNKLFEIQKLIIRLLYDKELLYPKQKEQEHPFDKIVGDYA